MSGIDNSLVIVGVDTGGTFTDVVYFHDGELKVLKLPSTPDNPAEAVLEGFRQLMGDNPALLIHGSTVATNALLERRGAKTALITTEGFEDVLEIGRQNRNNIYALVDEKPPTLIPRMLRFGIRERVGPAGDVLVPVELEKLDDWLDQLEREKVESLAICLLHSYANPEHEQMVRDRLKDRFGGYLSLSSDILPEYREYERTSTTAVNAYVGPIMSRYLGDLERRFDHGQLRIMQSNGGSISVRSAMDKPVRTILSGPAGGAVGGFELGTLAGFDHVITFDMGGTSTDVSLCPGGLRQTMESEIGGSPIRVPVIDIHTVGAGGGSIATIDQGGALKVGPRSAGAVPGPICYNAGGKEITVTDANLIMGRLSPAHFLGGKQRLDDPAARGAIEALAREMNLTPVELAQGILDVANTTMERAIRVISVERGFDPKDFCLVSFGGAGGMHAVDLARALSIPKIMIPPAAGVISAVGMLMADMVRDYSHTVLWAAGEIPAGGLDEEISMMRDRAISEFAEDGYGEENLTFEPTVDVRYAGQGFEISVPYDDDWQAAFHNSHEQRYGYADPARAIVVVNARLRVSVSPPKPTIPEWPEGGKDHSAAVLSEHIMIFAGEEINAVIINRDMLKSGNEFYGPALIVEYSTTTVLPPGHRCQVDRRGNLIIDGEVSRHG